MSLNFEKGLLIPESLLKAHKSETEAVFNKCGPDGFLNKLVPNHLLGLDIGDSCNIHDWTFVNSKNQKDHQESDKIFLKNMKSQIKNKKSNLVIKYIRYVFSYIYFWSVRLYSDLKKKNNNDRK